MTVWNEGAAYVENILHPPERRKNASENLALVRASMEETITITEMKTKTAPSPHWQERDDSTNKKATHFTFFSITIDESTESSMSLRST